MLKAERQQQILSILSAEGKVLAADLPRLLQVSDDTIRRDLQELGEQGSLLRVHGGALVRSAPVRDYNERKNDDREAKCRIGRAAAALVQNGQTIFFDGGTTTIEVARALPYDSRITAITNSAPIAAELCARASVDVIMIGGRMMNRGQVVTGPDAVEQVRRFRADLTFLGTCAIHRKHGITIPDADEAHVKRAMLACSAQTVGLATAGKLNTVAANVVGQTDDLRYLITDASAGEDLLRKFRKLSLSLIVAE